MKYFREIYNYIKNEKNSSYNISNEDLNLYKKEESVILRSIGQDFKKKYFIYGKLHDCPIVSIKIDFTELKKCMISMTFLCNESKTNKTFTIFYTDVYDYSIKVSNSFISCFNMIKGNKCLISEFSKDNRLYSHELAFSDGSRVIIRFKNAKSIYLNEEEDKMY